MAKGFNLDNSPAHLLRRATQYANDIYTREVVDETLTARQFAVLLTVDKHEGLSQTDLVNMTGIDRSTLADMISRMLKKDLLRRKRTESDARANSVSITTSGKRALTTVLAKGGESRKPDPRAVAVRQARRFHQVLDDYRRSGPAPRLTMKSPRARRKPRAASARSARV